MQIIHPKCVNVFQKLSDHVFKSSRRMNHVSFDNSFTSDIITFNQSKCLHAKMCDYTLKNQECTDYKYNTSMLLQSNHTLCSYCKTHKHHKHNRWWIQ